MQKIDLFASIFRLIFPVNLIKKSNTLKNFGHSEDRMIESGHPSDQTSVIDCHCHWPLNYRGKQRRPWKYARSYPKK